MKAYYDPENEPLVDARVNLTEISSNDGDIKVRE